MEDLIVAVDGGGSKTHAVALTREGELVGFGHGPASSPELVGVDASLQIVGDAVTAATGTTVSPVRAQLYLAGLDLHPQLIAYGAAARDLPWGQGAVVADNDLFALLRAGTESRNAVAVVCGTGINGVGVRDDGRSVRFPALGTLSGDWGGGRGIGEEALWHAARAEDGRGPDTALREEIIRRFAADTVLDVIEDIHFGRRSALELASLAPAILTLARQGDPIAEAIADRQAAEIVAYVRACIERLGMNDIPVPIVLGGGVLTNGDARLLPAIAAGIAAIHPTAELSIGGGIPVVGAALLALEAAAAESSALRRARDEIQAYWDLAEPQEAPEARTT